MGSYFLFLLKFQIYWTGAENLKFMKLENKDYNPSLNQKHAFWI